MISPLTGNALNFISMEYGARVCLDNFMSRSDVNMAIILPATILLFYVGLHRMEQFHSPILRRLLFFFSPAQKKNMECAELCLGGSKEQRCK